MERRRRRRPSLLLRAFPSFTDVAFLMPLVFLFVKLNGARTLLGDGDTGWHIRAGDWMLANGAVPREDMFSFTRAGEEWFAWEWLWDAGFAWVHAAGGLEAVVAINLLVICLTSALLYRVVRRRAGDAVIAIAVTILATAAVSIHWLARPHLFTLLFGVVLYDLAERTAEDRRWKRLVWAPALFALWANLHGGFLAGVLLLGCYFAGALTTAATAPTRDQAADALRSARPWGLALLASAAATLLTPYGWKLHQHIYGYLTESYHFEAINEFQSLNFQHPGALYFELMLVLAAGAVVMCVARRRFAHLFLLAGWAHLALVSARNIPIFAIFAAPAAAEALVHGVRLLGRAPLAGWIRANAAAFQRFASDMTRTDAPERLHLASAGGFVVIALLLAAPDAGAKFKASYDPSLYPEAALAAVDELGFTRVFSSDEWGDYLIYRRYPKLKVFIDGRSDFYGAEFGRRYLTTMSVQPGWRKNLDDDRIDAVLLSVQASLSGALKESSAWSTVYDDGTAVIFQRRESDSDFYSEPGGGGSASSGITAVSSIDWQHTEGPNQ